MFKNSSSDQILISNTCKVRNDDFDLIEKNGVSGNGIIYKIHFRLFSIRPFNVKVCKAASIFISASSLNRCSLMNIIRFIHCLEGLLVLSSYSQKNGIHYHLLTARPLLVKNMN
jgi:hypothetical protein